MTTSTLNRAIRAVEWQDIGTYTTKGGKPRKMRRGIPLSPFWRIFKSNREELRKAGIQLAISGETQVYSRKNGKTKTKKLWEVWAWNLEIFG